MIKHIYQDLKKLESQGLPWDLLLLQSLHQQLQKLSGESTTNEQKKLADLFRHLKTTMSEKTLHDVMVPFERYLQKSRIETDFLITTEDQPLVNRKTFPIQFVLENLRSSFNVGAMFRTAEAMGLEKLNLTGYTATPENLEVQKTSLGSHAAIPWQSYASAELAIKELKKNGYHVIAVETSEMALDITASYTHKPTAFVFGNERFGLNPETIQQCDEIRRIPLWGIKNSLNVGICAGIIAFEWLRQRQHP